MVVLGTMLLCWLMVLCLWLIVRYPHKALEISFSNGKLKFRTIDKKRL